MNILDLYTSVLAYAGLEVDKDGFVFTAIENHKNPAMINGMRLVLPTDQQLKSVGSEKIVFHPLSENVLRGESDVISKLRDVINVRLNFTFGILGQSLLNLAASPELHHKLSPDQTDLLLLVKEADATSVKNFVSVMLAGMKNHPDRTYVNIYLKRGGNVGDKRYARAGIVSFPFFEELKKEENTVFGVKIRSKDKETFRKLYEFLFPNVAVIGSYNHGSNSDIAPFLDALMKTSLNIASRFNDVTELFKEFIDEAEKLVFDSDWVSTFDNLEVMLPELRRIPMQAGNEGKVKASESTIVTPPTALPQEPARHQAVTAPQAPAPVQQPAVFPGYQQPQPPPVQQPPQPKHTARGVDFQSVLQSTPAVAYGPNAMASYARPQYPGMPPQGMMQQGPAVPTWAQPGSGYNQPAPMQYPPGYPQQYQQQYPQQYPQQGMMQYPQQPWPNPMGNV